MFGKSLTASAAALAVASLAGGPAAAQESFFQGAYAGGHIQNAVMPFDTKRFDTSGGESQETQVITNEGVAEGPGLGAFIGVGRRNEGRYYGAEAGFGLASASYERDVENGNDDLLVTKESQFNISGRAGLVQTEQALFYGRFGWTSAQMEFQIRNESVQRKNVGGLIFGAGIETPLLKAVNLRGEFVYTAYNSARVSYNNGDNEKKFILREKTLRLAALYRF